jgi:hypothetical protein
MDRIIDVIYKNQDQHQSQKSSYCRSYLHYIWAKKTVVYNRSKNYIVICTGKLFGCQVVRVPMWLSGCHVVVNLWGLGCWARTSLPLSLLYSTYLEGGRGGRMSEARALLSLLLYCTLLSRQQAGGIPNTQCRNAVTPFMRHATFAGYNGGKTRGTTFMYV